MLDGLQALLALQRTGTISKAAVQLRLTQSAVSKRIQSLEAELRYKVVEPDGRKLRLTEHGILLLQKAKPLLVEIEGLKDLKAHESRKFFALGISDSIAGSWGPKAIRKTLQQTADIDLEIHVHRSTLILEFLRTGRYDLGFVTGRPSGTDLIWSKVAEEPMVIVGEPSTGKSEKRLLTIESNSATWKDIGQDASGHPKLQSREFVFTESFAAAAQMAKEDFGHALIPLGVAFSMGFKKHHINPVVPQLRRHIYLAARKSIANSSAVSAFGEALATHAKDILRSSEQEIFRKQKR